MKKRTMRYFSKNRALKLFGRPTQLDLHTFLSATFAIAQSRVVKQHVQSVLHELNMPSYKLSA